MTKNGNSTSAVVTDSGTSTDCRLKKVVMGACWEELLPFLAGSLVFMCSLTSYTPDAQILISHAQGTHQAYWSQSW